MKFVDSSAQLSNMTVILTARNFEKGQSASKQLKDKGMDVIFYQLDVSNYNDIKNISLQIEHQYGRLDVLVNNAAILYEIVGNTLLMQIFK